MGHFSVRPAVFEDCAAVAAVVRPEDEAECLAASGLSVREALERGFPFTTVAYTGYVDDQIVGMAGVSHIPEKPEIGIPWMMTSKLMDKVAGQFLRVNRDRLDEMKEGHQLLVNYVDARNVKAIRWLKWLGFYIFEAEPYGVSGLPFHRFEMEV